MGLLERNQAYYENAAGIELAQKLVGPGETFLYLSRTSVKAQATASAGGLLLIVDPNAEHKSTIEIEQELKEPTIAKTVQSFIDVNVEKAKPEANWFFYSNAPGFADYFNQQVHIDDIGKGALLLLRHPSDEKTVLPHAVANVVSQLQPTLVLVDGDEDVQFDFPSLGKDAPLVLRLREKDGFDSDALKNRIDVATSLRQANPNDTSILFMMPETRDEALAWHFPEEQADRYATNGKRIRGDLDRFGFAARITKVSSSQSALDASMQAAQSGKRLLIMIGESSDLQTIRIPGSAETVNPRQISTVAQQTTVLGLVCNSQTLLSNAVGLGIVGTVYTDQIRNMLRVLLDKREDATIREYLDIPIQSTTAAHPQANLSDTVSHLVPHLTAAAGSPSLRPVLFKPTPLPSPPPQPAQNGQTQAQPKQESGKLADPAHLPGWIFLAGAIGAVAREFLRWKRLASRKRADLFFKPQYYLISIMQTLLGGAVALIWTPVVSGKWIYPVAFICGAGLEELIKRASRLEIWTPSVAHGPTEGRSDSVLEYLRN